MGIMTTEKLAVITKISDQSTALKLVAQKLTLTVAEMPEGLTSGTAQVWVRPATHQDAVMFYKNHGPNFHEMAADGGTYDDLSLFPATAKGITSVRIPPYWSIAFFSDKNCKGDVYVASDESYEILHLVDNDIIKTAQSMIIHDPNDINKSTVIGISAERQGQSQVFEMGRHVLSKNSIKPLKCLLVPRGINVFTFSDAEFSKPLQTLTFPFLENTTDVAIGSLIVARSENRDRDWLTADSDSENSNFLVNRDGIGLSLDLVQSTTPTSKPYSDLCGQKLRNDKWAHLAFTWDVNTLQYYLNGRLVSTQQTDVAFNVSGPWTLGGDFCGEVGPISLHNSLMTQQDISTGRYNLPDADTEGLIECWPMNNVNTDAVTPIKGDYSCPFENEFTFWVTTKFPVSIADSPTAHIKATEVQQHIIQTRQARLNKANTDLEKAHVDGSKALREAHEKAEAKSYFSHVTRIFAWDRYQLILLDKHGQVPLIDNNKFNPDIPYMANGPSRNELITSDLYSHEDETKAFALDPVTKVMFISLVPKDARKFPRQSQLLFNLPNLAPQTLCELDTTIMALAVDPSGWSKHPVVYGVDNTGQVLAIEVDAFDVYDNQTGEYTYKPTRKMGKAKSQGTGHYSLAVNEKSKFIVWSNGHEIWRMNVIDPSRDYTGIILVNHAQSPNPIAVAIDDLSGDVYWVDGVDKMVRRLIAKENRVVDLYPAPIPRPGIDLDIFRAEDLQSKDVKYPSEATQKRIYWTSNYEQEVGATLISDIGVFAELSPVIDSSSTIMPSNMVRLNNAPLRDYRPNTNTKRFDLAGQKIFDIWLTDDGTQMAITYIDKYFDKPSQILSLRNLITGESKTIEGHYSCTANSHGGAVHSATGRIAVREDGKVIIRYFSEFGVEPSDYFPKEVTLLWSKIKLDFYSDKPFRDFRFPDGEFSADGRYLISQIIWRHNYVTVWDTLTGKVSMGLKSKKYASFDITSRDGQNLLFAQMLNNKVGVWDMSSGQQLHCTQPLGAIHRIALNKSGDRLAITPALGGIRVFDALTLTELMYLDSTNTYNLIGFLHDGQHIYGRTHEGQLRIWDLSLSNVVGQVRAVDSHHNYMPLPNGRQAWAISYSELNIVDFYCLPDRKVAHFDGETSWGSIDAFLLQAEHGFSVQMQVCPEVRGGWSPEAQSLLHLGEIGQGQIDIYWTEKHALKILITTQDGRVTNFESPTFTKDQEFNQWQNISVSIDPLGWGTISISGAKQVNFNTNAIENGLRTNNMLCRPRHNHTLEIARHTKNIYQQSFKGELGVFRMFNRSLSAAEIKKFSDMPSALPAQKPLHRDQILVTKTDGLCHLMSGMSDGSTPAIPLMQLKTDGGLVVQSTLGEAHTQLIDAQQVKFQKQRQAAHDLNKAEQDAAARQIRAHKDNKNGLQKAAKMINDGKEKAAKILAPAEDKVAKAKTLKEANVAAAWDQHYNRLDVEREKKWTKINKANAIKEAKTAPVAKRLAEAQKKRDAT
jgi:hypothetical protein